jgi:hypothetical protein
MADWQDEARRIRHRLKDAEDLIWRLHREPFAADSGLILRTKTETTYPTAAASSFACDILRAGGVEEEGAAAELTVVSHTVYALNVGTKLPPVGTDVVAIYEDGRWAFQYDGEESG